MGRTFIQISYRTLFGVILLLLLGGLGGPLIAQSKNEEPYDGKARTLKQYHDEIKSVGDDLSSLYSISKKDLEEWSRQDQAELEKSFYRDISTRLPARENIAWPGGEIEVDNRWLHTRLEDLKKLPIESQDRDPIVTELSERLSAIEAKLEEVEASTAATRNKDEEKQKLAQILERPEYQAPEKKEKGALERWWESFSNWLRGLFPKPEPMQPVESGPAGGGIPPLLVQILIVGAALAIIVFVIWRFGPTFSGRRRSKKTGKDSGERIILGERLAANESSASLFGQAESMAQEGNFRGAIRKGYIALLCELGDRKIIRLAQHKTNRDYLRDVSRDKELHRGVGELTSIFEDHWYGLSSASEEDWGAFRENYRYSTDKF